MYTLEKINIYKKYRGYYDGYHIQNKNKDKIITVDEWILLDKILQDIYLIRTNRCSKSFENSLIELLIKNCDSKETYNLVFELEKFINE